MTYERLLGACVVLCALACNDDDTSPIPNNAPSEDAAVSDDAGESDGSATSSDAEVPQRTTPDAGQSELPADPSQQHASTAFDASTAPSHPLIAHVSFDANPNPAAPLVGNLSLQLKQPAALRVLVEGGGENWTLTEAHTSVEHQSWVVGLKPATTYELTLELTAEDGTRASASTADGLALGWTTPSLPDDFPPLDFVASEPERMDPGMTLLQLRAEEARAFYLMIVDAGGVVRWWYQTEEHQISYGNVLSPWGTLVFLSGRNQAVETDWAGNVLATWHAADYPGDVPTEGIPIAAEAFHHDIDITPSGNIVTLGSELRTVESYPTSTTDALAPVAPATVVGDVITEFTRDGDLVTSISLLDVLDPHRVGRSSLGTWWNAVYPSSKDWSHGNSITYDPESDAYLVSVRNQEAVVKISRATGELLWILGNHYYWGSEFEEFLLSPVGDLEWPYHQHAAEVTPNGVGMFDNGGRRAPTYEDYSGAAYSRAVEFVVDEESMTVTQSWSFGPPGGEPGSFFATIMSDADWLRDTGNVLITAGSLEHEQTPDSFYTRLFEVTASGDIVFDLQVIDESGTESFSSFGADRIPDIRRLW